MAKINFSNTGGFPFKQYTLNKMQESMFDLFNSILNFIRVNETTGKFIISGCIASSGTISPGWMYIDGDLIKFEGASGNDDTKFLKAVTAESVAFKNGENKPVYYTAVVQIDSSGTKLSDFTRLYPVFDENYNHTDENFTTALLDKLNGIEAEAQKNVIPDFEEDDPESPKYIENKPNFLKVLKVGSANLGAIGSDTTTVINFDAISTNNYMVLGNIESINTYGNRSQDIVVWCSADHRTTRFDLMILDIINTGVRNIKFHYTLIELP